MITPNQYNRVALISRREQRVSERMQSANMDRVLEVLNPGISNPKRASCGNETVGTQFLFLAAINEPVR